MSDLQTQLLSVWSEVRGGQGRLVHIEGRPGSGKSVELTRLLRSAGKTPNPPVMVRINCTDLRAGATGRPALASAIVRIAEGVRATVSEPDTEQIPWMLPGARFLDVAGDLAELPRAPEVPAIKVAEVYAQVLLDVARGRPVVLALDDVHRIDLESRAILMCIAEALSRTPRRLLIVTTSATPLSEAGVEVAEAWRPEPALVLEIPPLDAEVLGDDIKRRFAHRGAVDPGYIQQLCAVAAGNAHALDALLRAAEHRGALQVTVDPIADPGFEALPLTQGIQALASGQVPSLPAHIRADLDAVALAGSEFDDALLARVWQVSVGAAQARIQAIADFGLVEPHTGGWSFWSTQLIVHCVTVMAQARRQALRAALGRALRITAQIEPQDIPRIDVTETWLDNRHRRRKLDETLNALEAAAAQLSAAGCPVEAAEASVTLAEGLLKTAVIQQSPARTPQRARSKRRARVMRALDDTETLLARASRGVDVDGDRLAIDIRLSAARAQAAQAIGDFTSARAAAQVATRLAAHGTDTGLAVEALRVKLNVLYAAGDHHAGRQALRQLLSQLPDAPPADAIRIYAWLAEAIGQWEAIGLHDRIFTHVLAELDRLGAGRASIKAQVERLTAAVDHDDDVASEALLVEVIESAQVGGHTSYLAEMLALYSGDLLLARVEQHFDSLSGEFFPPDLYGEGISQSSPPLAFRIARPLDLLKRAQEFAAGSSKRVTHLRVLTTVLWSIYEARERLAEILDRWVPIHRDGDPIRLREVAETLNTGLLDAEHIAGLTRIAVELADELGLEQVKGDTLYEALDRQLPGTPWSQTELLAMARKAYECIGDIYGLITLDLVEARLCGIAELDPQPALTAAAARLARYASELTTEQRAFVHLRLGQRTFRDDARNAETTYHLEEAIRGYDELGDVARIQQVGEMLREVYRRLGDLARYRMLRDRFQALEAQTGVDASGLELRIEHLLSRARQETDEERAIRTIEHCIELYGRLPGSTSQIDECLVEISKICRRKADEATTESVVKEWLRRSLRTVQSTITRNRKLGSFNRVFEEYHELFDDLLGIGDTDDYLRARAECRGLAFSTGNIRELLYLFDEHLQFDPAVGLSPERLIEIRGFYEALVRMLLGLGARERGLALQRRFIEFLTEVEQSEVADLYAKEPIG